MSGQHRWRRRRRSCLITESTLRYGEVLTQIKMMTKEGHWAEFLKCLISPFWPQSYVPVNIAQHMSPIIRDLRPSEIQPNLLTPLSRTTCRKAAYMFLAFSISPEDTWPMEVLVLDRRTSMQLGVSLILGRPWINHVWAEYGGWPFPEFLGALTIATPVEHVETSWEQASNEPRVSLHARGMNHVVLNPLMAHQAALDNVTGIADMTTETQSRNTYFPNEQQLTYFQHNEGNDTTERAGSWGFGGVNGGLGAFSSPWQGSSVSDTGEGNFDLNTMGLGAMHHVSQRLCLECDASGHGTEANMVQLTGINCFIVRI